MRGYSVNSKSLRSGGIEPPYRAAGKKELQGDQKSEVVPRRGAGATWFGRGKDGTETSPQFFREEATASPPGEGTFAGKEW